MSHNNCVTPTVRVLFRFLSGRITRNVIYGGNDWLEHGSRCNKYTPVMIWSVLPAFLGNQPIFLLSQLGKSLVIRRPFSYSFNVCLSK